MKLKRNIKSVESSLNRIVALQPVDFVYKSQTDNEVHRGLIAQEAGNIDPAYVTRDRNGTLGIRLSSVVADLIGAVKEQNEVIEDQRTTIKNQAAIIKKLEMIYKGIQVQQELLWEQHRLLKKKQK